MCSAATQFVYIKIHKCVENLRHFSPSMSSYQGLMPPVPMAISKRPTKAPAGFGGSPTTGSMAVTLVRAFPKQYTMDKYNMVRN